MFFFISSGLVDTMKQGESANWSFNPEQMSDLASSLNNFFTQVGSNSPRQNISHQYDDNRLHPLSGTVLSRERVLGVGVQRVVG